MINIIYNGEAFDLEANTSIDFTENNDFFNLEQTLDGSYSLPFKLPLTPKNRRLLGFIDRLDVPSDSSEVAVKILYKDLFVRSGFMTVKSCGNAGYDVDIMIERSRLKEFADIRLRDLDLGVEQIHSLLSPTQDELIMQLNHIAANPDEYNYLFPTIGAPDFYINGPVNKNRVDPDNYNAAYPGRFNDYDGYINQYAAGTYIKNYIEYISLAYTIHQTNSYVPMFKLGYIINKVFEACGVNVFDGYILNNSFYKNIIIFNSTTIDVKFNSVTFSGYAIWNQECSNYITVANHLPDITIGEFLKSVGAMFGLVFNLTGNDVLITDRETVLSADIELDLTSNKIQGHVKRRNPDTEYSFTMTVDDNDATAVDYNNGLYLYNANDKNKQVETLASYPVKTLTTNRIITWVSNTATKEDMDLTGEFSLRFLLYRGLENDALSDPFPYATAYDHLPINETSYYDESLLWDGATGLIAKRHQRFIDLQRNSIEADIVLNLTLAELLSIRKDKRVRIDNQNWIIKQLKYRLDAKGLSLVTATIVKT